VNSVEFARNGDIRLAYECAGRGELVVFLHGIGGNRANWDDQVEAFGKQYMAVAWDARGYGDSDDPIDGLRFSEYASDLECLLDSLGADKAHLVGLSMGGMIAQDFIARHPERAATVTLAGTSSGFGVLSEQAKAEFLDKRLRPLQEGKSLREMAPGMVDVLVAGKAPQAARQRVQQSLEALRPDPYQLALHAILKTDFRDVIPSISIPCLVLVGSEDRVLPPAHSEALAAAIPGAELVVLDGVGHLSNIEAPRAFNDTVLDFLRRQGQSPDR